MIEKCLGSLRKWNEKRQIRNICRNNLVSLRKSDGEMVSIYNGGSEGYKSDYNVDVGKIVLEKIQNEENDCELILRPNAITRKNLNINEKVLPFRVVPLKLKKH